MNNLGLVFSKLEKPSAINYNYEEALKYFQESLNIRKQLLPPNHNDNMQSLDNMIRLMHEAGHPEGSMEYFAQILTIKKIDFDPNDNDALLKLLSEKYGPFIELPRKMTSIWPPFAEHRFKAVSSQIIGNEVGINKIFKLRLRY